MNEHQRYGEVEVKRLGRNGYLHRIIPIVDSAGNVVERLVRPLMVEFHGKDVLQTVIGSALLAIPGSYTEEAWNLGAELPNASVAGIALLSLLFIGTFVYFNFYKGYMRGFVLQFVLRVAATYLVSLTVVATILTIILLAPWDSDLALAIKRTVIVAFPASMAATVADALK